MSTTESLLIGYESVSSVGSGHPLTSIMLDKLTQRNVCSASATDLGAHLPQN